MGLKYFLTPLLFALFIGVKAQITLSQKAKQYYESKDYKNAIKLYDKLVDSKEADYMDYYYRANTYMELKKYQAAYDDFTASINLAGNFAENYLLRGAILVNSELIQDAINDFNMAIKYAKNDTVKCLALISRAGAKLYTQNYKSAMKDCKDALSIDSVSTRSRGAYVNLSTCYGYLHENEKSVELLKRMYLLDSSDVSTIGNLGYELTGMERYSESLYYFDRALKLRPNDAYVLSNKSYAYLKLGKTEEAYSLIQKSIKFKPGNSYAYRNLGLIYLKMKEKEKACEAFQTALKKGFNDIYGDEVQSLIKKHCN
jgi:tetratricopeptide (TPR) repeat protein